MKTHRLIALLLFLYGNLLAASVNIPVAHSDYAAQSGTSQFALRLSSTFALSAGNFAMLPAVALSGSFADLLGKPTTRSGYGITDAASETQGAKADTAVQPDALAAKLSGSYASLSQASSGTNNASALNPLTGESMVAQFSAQKSARLFKTAVRFTPIGDVTGTSAGALRIAGIGDSFISYGIPMPQMWMKYGYGGKFENQSPSLASGATFTGDSTLWPGQMYTHLGASGASAVYPPWTDAGGNVTPPAGGILAICYVTKSGSNVFKVQTDTSGSSPGSWSDVTGYTAVNTDNGGGAASPKWLFIDLNGVPQNFRIRCLQISGSPDIIFAQAMTKNNYGTGGNRRGTASYLTFGQGGTTPSDWLASSAANWNAMLGGYDPHLVIISSFETLSDWQTYLPTVIGRIRTAAPNADIGITSQPPSAYGVGPNDDNATNDFLRSYCQQNGLLWIDTARHFPTYTYRVVTDCVTISGSSLITSASANFTSADIGSRVTVVTPGLTTIASGGTISTVLTGSTALLTVNASASGTGNTLNVADASLTQYYADPPHLSNIGTLLSQRIVWNHLSPLLAYNGSVSTQGIYPDLGVGGGVRTRDFFIINPTPGQSTRISVVNEAGGSSANYPRGGGFSFIDDSIANVGGAMAIYSPQYGGSNVGAYVKGGQWFFGGNLPYGDNSLGRFPTGNMEVLAQTTSMVPQTLSGRPGQTAHLLDFRTNADETTPGTVASYVDANGKFNGAATSADSATSLTGTNDPAHGGTGTAAPNANGQIPIGNSGGLVQWANIVAGAGITVTNGTNSITIAANGVAASGTNSDIGTLSGVGNVVKIGVQGTSTTFLQQVVSQAGSTNAQVAAFRLQCSTDTAAYLGMGVDDSNGEVWINAIKAGAADWPVRLSGAGGGAYIGVRGSSTKMTGVRHGVSGAMTSGTVSVSDTSCTSSTRYFFTTHTIGTVTAPSNYYASTRNSGTSFIITSSQATDTSTVDWLAIEP